MGNGELVYHLSVLEREGIVKSTTKGARRLYYPAEAEIPENGGGLHEVQVRILKHVEDVPGMSVRDVAALLGITPQLAMYHLRKLHAEHEGRRNVLCPRTWRASGIQTACGNDRPPR